METFKILFRDAWSCMKQQTALQILQELHGEKSYLDKHGTAWSHSVNFKYHRSCMETFKI